MGEVLQATVPIIAAILMLLSPKARVTSVGFLLGWVLGIALATTLFTLLASVLPEDDDGPAPIRATLQLVLGALLVLLAGRQWRGRPKSGEEPRLPGWMKAVDGMSFTGAGGLGLLLSAVNPKNLLLAAAAGVSIGSAGLAFGSTLICIVVFTIVAASTVLIPVIGYLVAASRLAGPLDALRGWLAKENAVIMTVVLLILGVVLLGKGIAGF